MLINKNAIVSAILQRATYKVGLLTIQGVSTCLYLCMDACGFQYASVSIIVLLQLLLDLWCLEWRPKKASREKKPRSIVGLLLW